MFFLSTFLSILSLLTMVNFSDLPFKVDKDSFKRLQEIKIEKNYLARPGNILFYKINLNYSNTITHLKVDSYYEGLFETGDGQNNLTVYLSKFVPLTHLSIQIFSTDISSTVIINQLNMVSVLSTCKKLTDFSFIFYRHLAIDITYALLNSIQKLGISHSEDEFLINHQNSLQNSTHKININLRKLELFVRCISRAEIVYILQFTPVLDSLKIMVEDDSFFNYIINYGASFMQQFTNRIMSSEQSSIEFGRSSDMVKSNLRLKKPAKLS